MIKVAINGFGRIGRLVFRIMEEDPEMEVVAINDLTDPEQLAYLLKYDTSHRRYLPNEITYDEDGIIVKGRKIKIYAEMDPSNLPWKDLDIDAVFECTGKFTSKDKAMAHINAGAKKVYLIEEPIAAAIGAGIDISKPYGSMIVDIGGGTTDIAVISLGGSVKSTSLKMAGDKFDEAIIKYIKKNRNIIIGERTAEDIKINIGCMYPKSVTERMLVKGRDITSGLPVEIEVTSDEVYNALSECAEKILEGVHSILEETPPELVADISERGIYITGGGGMVWGLDKLISEKTGIPVMIAEDAQSCVAIGTGKALNHVELLESGNAIKIKKF